MDIFIGGFYKVIFGNFFFNRGFYILRRLMCFIKRYYKLEYILKVDMKCCI